MKITAVGYEGEGYDYTQRAYEILTTKENVPLEITLLASEDSPVVNPVFVIKNWNGQNVQLEINDQKVKRGKDFRYGIEYDVEGNVNLIVWIKVESNKAIQFVLTPEPL